MISSLSAATLAVAVVEPTPSGRHDFVRVADLCAHFRIPLAVLINKADLNAAEAAALAESARTRGGVVVGELPFDPAVTEGHDPGGGPSPKLLHLLPTRWRPCGTVCRTWPARRSTAEKLCPRRFHFENARGVERSGTYPCSPSSVRPFPPTVEGAATAEARKSAGRNTVF